MKASLGFETAEVGEKTLQAITTVNFHIFATKPLQAIASISQDIAATLKGRRFLCARIKNWKCEDSKTFYGLTKRRTDENRIKHFTSSSPYDRSSL